MEYRFASLLQILREKSLSAIIVSTPSLIAYLTKYYGFSQVEREAFLIITAKSSYLLTDTRYSEATIRSVPYFTTLLLNSQTPLSYHLVQVVENAKGIVGFEAEDISVSEYTKLKKTNLPFTPISLRSIRAKKDAEEIRAIKKAADIAQLALKKIKPKIDTGMTEREVAELLENGIRGQKADIAFPTIVAFGKNASVPHHMTGNTKLKRNDLVLIDFGAKWRGYCSDCTRTFFVGDVPKKWKIIYKTVQLAQQEAIKHLESRLTNQEVRIKASDIDKVARDFITSRGYPTIPHSVGHGIGLEVHEAPSLSSNSNDILEEGMVFSIEPGIYIEGKLGVRIEDLFTISDQKLLKLT